MKNSTKTKMSINTLKVVDQEKLTKIYGGTAQNLEESLAPSAFTSLFDDTDKGSFSSLFSDIDK